MKNITYLFGAGASFFAYPIWKAQVSQMIGLAGLSLNCWDFSRQKNPYSSSDKNFILWEIGHYGMLSEKFYTVDTLAKKFWLNGENEELIRLKFAISLFFTLWLKRPENPVLENNPYPDKIDRRYVSLLATILQPNSKGNPIIPKNINFITWNYDLQFELAYKMFCRDQSWKEIKKTLNFTSDYGETLQVCHLNGYHGYYLGKDREVDIMDRSETGDFNDVLERISYTTDSIFEEKIRFADHINFAWELDSEIAVSTRARANQIFANTDILIIVGYSFPAFNMTIDEELFGNLKNENVQIIYQDPHPASVALEGLLKHSKNKSKIISDRMIQFEFPR